MGARTPTVRARDGMLLRACSAYNSSLQSMPYRTKAATSCFMSACGDVLAQRCEENTLVEGLDSARTARQAIWGLGIAPVTHNIFALLARIPPVGPIPATVLGLVVDQVCFSAPIHAAYFAWVSCASSGFTHSLSEVKAEVGEKLLPAMKTGLAVWPAALYFNLVFVPLRFRVLCTNFVGLGYGTLMSKMANSREQRLSIGMAAIS